MTNKRLIEIAKLQVANIPERYPGYRELLVKRLVDIIVKQREGLPQPTRSRQVGAIVDAFGAEVAAQVKDVG